MEDIGTRIEKISANKSKYGIENLEAGETLVRLNDGLALKVRRTPTEEELEVVGFEKDIEKLANLLKQEECQQFLVVSIVGMGGAGKSTLAKSVYNRSDIKNTFDSYAFIYVSQEYRIKDLLSGAITQVMMLTNEKKQGLEMMNEQELRKMLSDYLKERRCLFIFDDIWKREDWDRLKLAFLAQGEGKPKRVILTTRNVQVAKYADPLTDLHELSPLGDEDSFKLFSQKVFQYQVKSEERSYSKELEEIGRKLVARCSGLPLAIVVLGGLLSTKEKTPSVWSKLLDSVNWQFNHGPQQCMDILSLSYTDLPYYLQSCFLYFGLFPEDYEIDSDKLIRLWVAEGFIQQRGDETMEDVAEDYLEELIQRSIIQAASRRSDGGVETCRIHDILRDFVVSEAKKDKLLEIHGNNCSTSLNRFRRLAIHPNNGSWIEGGLEKLTNLKELVVHGDLMLHTKALTSSIVKLTKLRLLYLFDPSENAAPLPLVSFSNHVHLYSIFLDGYLEKLPELGDFPPYLTEVRLYKSHLKQDDQYMETFEKLPNLKILELGWDSFEGKELICSVGGFSKLRNLSLHKLSNLEDLKVEEGAFPCLKFLIISECNHLKMLPDGLRQVTTLQELNLFNMPEEFNVRVQENTGEDWEKIKHIPSVTIL
ncbi:hypothetical protein NE237_002495 [Protea cynaroides]|uniref:AAA+ ATPase domain-containing protein n=1 Tax=Protea cynaroides TaxID=273540 RepID=A0A9Q0KVI8_9MAGN|nr:hypothetical protein NE237_002495 [Protea cynaroides]